MYSLWLLLWQKNRLFSSCANERERCTGNGTEFRIWGEIGYSGVKKTAGKSDYFGKSSIKIYFCIGWTDKSFL
ncbi:hypothetical protein SAMN05216331_13320 [Porphyromonadaceae bacterium KH3R12]|nr:hypothetical protein SAMN05216331_13320 [Porphyromonadaceae bacterium KH3R12]